MGIRMLTSFLKETGCKGITFKHLSKFSNKRIVIDASIYMYRFLGEKALLENFYIMCGIFLKYNIHPLFVFDGKPPKEKEEEVQARHDIKVEAERKLKQLQKDMAKEKDPVKKMTMEDTLAELEKTCIRVRKRDVDAVKELIHSFGMQTYDAPNEADQVCAYMVIYGHAYACLSEDTDMFVYGCPYILRYMSLLNHTVLFHNLDQVLASLSITMDNFRALCVFSENDYIKSTFNIYHLFAKYNEFHQLNNGVYNVEDDVNTKIDELYMCIDENVRIPTQVNKQLVSFILSNTFGSNVDIDLFCKIYMLYSIQPFEYKNVSNLHIENKPIDMERILTIMEGENFFHSSTEAQENMMEVSL